VDCSARTRLLAAALVLVSVVGPAAAQPEPETPPARFGLVVAGRENLGDAGDVYRWGALAGINAGYHPTWFPAGVVWQVLFGHFEAADSGVVDQSLSTVEMSFGLHTRFALSETSLRYLFANAGVTLLRTENTLPPDSKRIFIGPYVGGGWEEYFLRRYLVGAEIRYGLIAGGPPAIGLHLSVSFGTL
jgi:hypothetical protein